MASATFVSVGHGNYVNASRVLAITGVGSSPIARLTRAAKAEGRLIDATHGRQTKSALVMDTGMVVLSGIKPETLARSHLRDGSPLPVTAARAVVTG